MDRQQIRDRSRYVHEAPPDDRTTRGPTSKADREEALDELKEEVAEDVGVDPDRYGGNVPAKKWGALGGHMVKRLIERGEEAMAEDSQEEETPHGPRS